MNIEFHSYTNKGGRPNNEDTMQIVSEPDYCAAIVCDGLGGQGGGETASQTAAECFAVNAAKIHAFEDKDLLAILSAANKAVVKGCAADPAFARMRTTIAGCVIDHDKLKCFNIGDSRFYFFRRGSLKFMSRDHSVPQLSVDMMVDSFDSLRFNPDRNRLTRVLGNEEMADAGMMPTEFVLESGDAFLVCSDGFWEYVYETEMEIDLAKAATAEQWIKYMLIRLLLRTDDNNDNYTVIAGLIV